MARCLGKARQGNERHLGNARQGRAGQGETKKQRRAK
jgi:hypothetical protein